jgi:hypothetical protein
MNDAHSLTCSACGQTKPEPPLYAVVIDDDGDAWQRRNLGLNGWYSAMPSGVYQERTWSDLVTSYGVKRIVYTPGDDA